MRIIFSPSVQKFLIIDHRMSLVASDLEAHEFQLPTMGWLPLDQAALPTWP